MLRSIDELTGYTLQAEDGEIGRCKDFLFDDEWWGVRYMVADTRKWLPGRKVLVSPISLGEAQWTHRILPVRLTKEQIEKAPGLEEQAPVSRQYEMRWSRYYHWPYYWPGSRLWGTAHLPGELFIASRVPEEPPAAEPPSPTENHIRSTKEVKGYHIMAADGAIGHVEDFIVDDGTWAIRYLVVDTRNWLPGRKVLVAPQWIGSVHWAERSVTTCLSTEAVKNSPPYDPHAPVNREYEERLYDFHGRPKYWV